MEKDKERKQRQIAYVNEWRKQNPDKAARYAKTWRQRNADYIKRKKREFRETNRESILEYQRQYRRQHKEAIRLRRTQFESTNPIRTKFWRYRMRAKARGYDFGLTFEQFSGLLSDASCVYCDATGKMGLDRVDNSRGYQTDNVVPCCRYCNTMKQTAKKQEFIQKCIQIADKYRHLVN